MRLPLSRLLLAGCLAFVAVAEVCAQGITRVYRADSRAPETVFFSGMAGRGDLPDVLAHALGGSCDAPVNGRTSAFVSTSADRNEGVGFATDQLNMALPATGPSTAMWLYTIRADNTYMEVSDLLGQAAAAGRNSLLGYTPAQAAVLETLRRTTVIASEHEVVTHYVAPRNIVSAQALYYTEEGDLYEGPVIPNPNYFEDNTAVDNRVGNLQDFVPSASIRINLIESSDSESNCTMSCDGASAPSSPKLLATGSLPKVCYGRPNVNALLMDVVINGGDL